MEEYSITVQCSIINNKAQGNNYNYSYDAIWSSQTLDYGGALLQEMVFNTLGGDYEQNVTAKPRKLLQSQ